MSPELIVTNSLRQYKEFFKVVADNAIEHIKIQENWMKINLTVSLLFGAVLMMLTACNWNRTEKAQQQIYAPGPDAPSALTGTLQRNQDYYKKSDGDLLKKMR